MTHVPWHPTGEETLEERHGVDSVELLSVGIDVGTTTTQLLFSRLLARRRGDAHGSEFAIEEREPLYESRIRLTPYENHRTDRIDVEAVEAFVDEAYAEAGYEPGDVDTGAVVVTGEASRAENAERVVDLFSARSGTFVCAVAGAKLEALMAAHGSGAVDYAVDEGVRLIHVDAGGGTTKLAFVDRGFVEGVASLNVGARLVAFDAAGRVTRLEPAARRVAADIGIRLERGAAPSARERERLAERFAELLFEVLRGGPSDLAAELLVTEPPAFPDLDEVTLTFSGGVAEYIYGREREQFGDLGPELGTAIRGAVERRGAAVAELETGIRATAVGSTQHTVQISGNTITVTDESVLPLRDVPMVPFVAGDRDADGLAAEIREKLDRYDVGRVDGPFALGFHLHGPPDYPLLDGIVDAAVRAWGGVGTNDPLVLAFEADVAMTAGRLAADRIDASVVSIDGVTLDQFGYLDVGEPLADTGAVPVTVKSLVFEG